MSEQPADWTVDRDAENWEAACEAFEDRHFEDLAYMAYTCALEGDGNPPPELDAAVLAWWRATDDYAIEVADFADARRHRDEHEVPS